MTTITGTFRESTTSSTSHTLTVPSGVSADMNFLIMIGSGSSTAFTSTLTAGGASFTKIDEQNAVNTRVAIWKGTGLTAGATVTITLSAAATLSIQHQYQDEYTYGTLSAAVRGASSASTTSGSLSCTTGQKIIMIGIERTTAGPTTVTSVTSSGGETINQTAYSEGATVQTSVYYGTFTASATASRTGTITYSDSSGNGYAALLGTSTGTGGGGGGSTGSTPNAVLNLGLTAGQNHFNLGVGYTSGHIDKTLTQLAAGFIEPGMFEVNTAGNGVVFSCPLNGGTTSVNTNYARVEFRELQESGDGSSTHPKAAWIPSAGTHYVKNRTKIVKVPPNKPAVCVMQQHDADDDTAMILTQLVSGKIILVARINGSQIGVLDSNYVVGTEFQIMIKLVNGTLGFYYNDMTTPKLTSTAFSNSETGQYFKTGCYNQSNTTIDTLSDGPFITEMRELECWHTGYANPTTPSARPAVNAGSDATIQAGTTFSRTVIETSNGSTITARTWKIVSGPADVNATIDTDSNLTWTPVVAGTYVLRYSATNAIGTGTDDVTVIVTGDTSTGGGTAVYEAKFMDGTPYPTIIEGTTTVNVTNNATLTSALAAATIGQKIVLANGTYGGDFTVSNKTTVTIQAATTGSAVFSSGTFTINNSNNVTVRGLLFNFDTGGDVFQFRGTTTNSRITRCTFGPSTHTESTAVSTYMYVGDNCSKIRIDHNEVRNKGTSGNGIRVYGNFDTFAGCKYVLIDHNYFHTIKPEVGNDKEPIRLGVSTMSRTDSFSVVERNYFTDCLCEPELTSIKMGSCRVTGNTYYRNAGGPVIRHGTGSILADNYVIDGNSTTATAGLMSGGPRFYDADHTIEHNYVFATIGSTFQAALLLDSGDAEGTSTNLSAHWRVVNAKVDRNVLVNTSTPIVIGNNYSTAPQNCSITNNITAGVTGTFTKPIHQNIAPVNATISGNLDFSTTTAAGLVADGDGIYRKDGYGPRLTYIDSTDVGPAGDTGDTDGTGGGGTGGGTGTAIPIVNAGADATTLANTAFARTATESGGGITTRSWVILSGLGAGAVLSSVAALSWTPAAIGIYTLRYSATNTAGTGYDDITVTVTTGGGPIVPPNFGRTSIGDSGASASVTLLPPDDVQPGDFQIAVIASAGPETISTVPANWILLDEVTVTSPSSPDRGGPHTSWVYYNTTGDNASQTWIKSGVRFWHGVRSYWRGQSGLGQHGVTGEASGSGSTTHTTPSVTPVRPNSRVVGIVINDLLNLAAGPYTPPSGWEERYDVTKISSTEYETITIADVLPDTPVGGGTPPPDTGNIMFTTAEITQAPSSGTAFTTAQTIANLSIGSVDLTNQDMDNAAICYTSAIFWLKTGTTSYKTKVETALAQLPTESTPPRSGETGGVLPVVRQLAGWIIAADLVGYRTTPFLNFADDIRTRFIGGHGLWDVVKTTSQVTANNWGTHALASRVACSAYLGDKADLDECANIFRRYTGENRAAWTRWVDTDDHDSTWVDSSPAAGINAAGAVATKAGAVVEDICRGPSHPSVDYIGISYSWEALQGAMVTAKLLSRAGYGDTFSWGASSLKRAAQFINSKTSQFSTSPFAAYPPRYPESQWVPYAINKKYTLSLGPLGSASDRGWAIAAASWIF